MRSRLVLIMAPLALVVAACTAPVASEQQAPTREPTSTSNPTSLVVPMVSVHEELRVDCQEAADTLGFAAPCPTRLPGTSGAVQCETPNAFANAEVEPKFGCVLGEGFILEPRIRASVASQSIGHFVIEAGRGAGLCTVVSETAVEVEGVGVHLARCDEEGGLHSQHVAAVWSIDGVQYVVSAHGQGDYHRQAVLATVRDIELVPPAA